MGKAGETERAGKERFADQGYARVSSQEDRDHPDDQTSEDEQRDNVDVAAAQQANQGIKRRRYCRDAKGGDIRGVVRFQEGIAAKRNGNTDDEQAQDTAKQ